MITPAPTTATASGLCPARIAGSTNSRSTAKLTASAASAASPRHRPRTSTAAANNTASQASDPLRWKSTTWYEPGSSGSPPDQPSTTGSPTVKRGVPGSTGTIWTRSRPARGPSVMDDECGAATPAVAGGTVGGLNGGHLPAHRLLHRGRRAGWAAGGTQDHEADQS